VSSRRVPNPGVWDVLPNGFAVGIRRDTPPSSASPGMAPAQDGLRRRFYSYSRGEIRPERSEPWQVWVAYHSGRQDIYETKPLQSKDEEGRRLVISELGPMVQVGTASVVVGFGDILKLVTVGHERFEKMKITNSTQEPWNVGSRRRKQGNNAAKAKANNAWR